MTCVGTFRDNGETTNRDVSTRERTLSKCLHPQIVGLFTPSRMIASSLPQTRRVKLEASQKQPNAHQIRAAHCGGVDRERVVVMKTLFYVVPELQTFLCVCVCLFGKIRDTNLQRAVLPNFDITPPPSNAVTHAAYRIFCIQTLLTWWWTCGLCGFWGKGAPFGGSSVCLSSDVLSLTN